MRRIYAENRRPRVARAELEQDSVYAWFCNAAHLRVSFHGSLNRKTFLSFYYVIF